MSFVNLLSSPGYELVREHEHLTPEELAHQMARIFFQGSHGHARPEERS